MHRTVPFPCCRRRERSPHPPMRRAPFDGIAPATAPVALSAPGFARVAADTRADAILPKVRPTKICFEAQSDRRLASFGTPPRPSGKTLETAPPRPLRSERWRPRVAARCDARPAGVGASPTAIRPALPAATVEWALPFPVRSTTRRAVVRAIGPIDG